MTFAFEAFFSKLLNTNSTCERMSFEASSFAAWALLRYKMGVSKKPASRSGKSGKSGKSNFAKLNAVRKEVSERRALANAEVSKQAIAEEVSRQVASAASVLHAAPVTPKTRKVPEDLSPLPTQASYMRLFMG